MRRKSPSNCCRPFQSGRLDELVRGERRRDRHCVRLASCPPGPMGHVDGEESSWPWWECRSIPPELNSTPAGNVPAPSVNGTEPRRPRH